MSKVRTYLVVFALFIVHLTARAPKETPAIRRLYLGAQEEKVRDEDTLGENDGNEGEQDSMGRVLTRERTGWKVDILMGSWSSGVGVQRHWPRYNS